MKVMTAVMGRWNFKKCKKSPGNDELKNHTRADRGYSNTGREKRWAGMVRKSIR